MPSGSSRPRRVLLVAPASSYRLDDFREAAARLSGRLDLLVATDRCPVLAEFWASDGQGKDARRSVPIDLRHPDRAAASLVDFDRALRQGDGEGFAGALGVDETTALVAALVAERLGLRGATPVGAAAARDKLTQRAVLSAAGLSVPRFAAIPEGADAGELAAGVGFPCVLKPRALSSSRGVIRADDAAGARAAALRIRKLLARPELEASPAARVLIVERFIPGAEVAVEALLREGRLEVLALFDKPDPLDGPFFEETLYVTPSRLSPSSQQAVADCVARAAAALGLSEGPIHAELRLDGERPWLLEVAARSIGGLCSRTLRFGAGVSLEELLLCHAAGLALPALERSGGASGVMMLPIPAAGTLHAVEGLSAARDVPGVQDVVISVRPGEKLVPLPEGNRYLGFAFARGPDPVSVEAALRRAHARLRFDIGPELPTA